MAWQGYVTSIMTEGNACKAGIFSPEGAAWAKSDGWEPDAREIAQLVAATKKAGPQRDAAYGNGLKIQGIKYKTVRFEDDEVWKGAAKDPEECACAYVCSGCVLVGIASGGHSASGILNKAVERNHRHLKDHGY